MEDTIREGTRISFVIGETQISHLKFKNLPRVGDEILFKENFYRVAHIVYEMEKNIVTIGEKNIFIYLEESETNLNWFVYGR